MKPLLAPFLVVCFVALSVLQTGLSSNLHAPLDAMILLPQLPK